MAVDKSQAPYYDDYDEDKKFLSILFRPEKAVQTRELNQLQTILQDQVNRVGEHLFKDGSMIIPGQINLDTDFKYAKISTAIQYNDIAAAIGGRVVGQTTGTEATLKAVTDVESSDPITLFLKYNDAGTGGTSSTFADTETLEIYDAADDFVGTVTCDETGIGSAAYVSKGIYFVRGYFVICSEQTLVLDKYTNVSSYRVGFDVQETVVDEGDDSSLFDNANGSINFTAPGAHRFKIDLVLDKKSLASTDDVDFIELMRIKDSVIQSKVRNTDYAVLEQTLARRTFDESGDYIVDRFDIDLIEHLDDGSNDGLLTVGEGGDADKIAVALDAGKAYVRGYEVSTESTTFIEAEKARDVARINNGVTNILVGNYVTVSGVTSLPNITAYATVDFKDGSDVDQGTARVRNIEYIDGTNYRLYLFDLRNTSGDFDVSFLATSTKVVDSDANEYTLANSNELTGTDKSSLLFKMPTNYVKTLKDGSNNVDTSFTVTRQFNTTSNASGEITLSAGTDEVFAGYSNTNYILALADGSALVDISGSFSLGGSPTGKSLTITGLANSTAYRLQATVVKQLATEKVKTSTVLSLSNQSLTGGRLSLGKADVYRINSVVKNGTAEDITDWFEIDTGKTENYYGISSLVLKDGYPTPPNIDVNVQYFTHSAGDYFSVDSYSSIDYDDIPTEFISGEAIPLSDVIDFRPRINDAGTDFSGTGSSYANFPKPNTFFRTDFDYYLNRIDKIVLSYTGEFIIVKGQSAVEPREPETPKNAMHLYTLSMPAYTKNITDIGVSSVDHKRYTMRDIGKLEQRINRLEYYTTLNALEKETSDMQILDSNGDNRFKNGFLVDTFNDHSVGDIENEDFKCSIDTVQGFVRPEFYMEGDDLEYNAASSANVQLTGDSVTLPYSEVTLIDQPSASTVINVNPYAVFSWEGDVKLSPNRDSWIDVKYTQPKLIEKTKVVEKKITQLWGWWKYRWNGYKYNNNYLDYRLSNPLRLRTYSEYEDNGFGVYGRRYWEALPRPTETTSQTTIGDRLVDKGAVPYMRSRVITVTGKGFKPTTRLYPFFDKKNVSTYCTPSGGSLGDPIVTDGAGNITLTFQIPNSTTLKFKTGTRDFILVDNNKCDLNAAQTSGVARYTAKGIINTRQKTILSTREITKYGYVHADQPTYQPIQPAIPTVVAVDQPRIYASDPTATLNTYIRPRIEQVNFSKNICKWRDPIAQSFLIDTRGGAFITSVDVYFSTKDSNIPVSLEIRDMANGYPGQNVVPNGVVTLEPADVNVSADASLATTFTFDQPVYIEEGSEMCFVVMANSTKYNMWIGTLGQKVYGTNRTISKQPYAGVMFKSQNNSTWTADQESDVKFKIKRASFTNGVVGEVILNNVDVSDVLLENNPIQTTNSSTTIRIRQENHGLFVGSQVTMSGATTGNNIPANELNTTHTVTSVIDYNQFEVQVTTSANNTGFIGGAAVLCGNNNSFNTLALNINALDVPGTKIDWTVRTTTGQSIGGSETPWSLSGTETVVINGDDNNFDVPMTVLNPDEETTQLAGAKSLIVKGYLRSDSENLSPVVDVDGSTAVYVSNIVNNPVSLSEDTILKGGNAFAKYITKPSKLVLPANSLKVFLDVNRPQGSSVKLFYKTANTQSELDQVNWTSLPAISESNETDDGQYYENEFGIDDLGDFSAYKIKIVMLSDSSSKVPSVDRLRVIALGT